MSQALRLHTKRHTQWDAKFRISQRAALAAIGRLTTPASGPTWVAKFKESKRGESVTLRFRTNQQLASVQREVSRHYGFKHISCFFVKDKNGWEMPVASDDALQGVLKQWSDSTALRTQVKFDELLRDIEQHLVATDVKERLNGVDGVWELACREDQRPKLLARKPIIAGLLEGLSSGNFALCCHAAAAVHMLCQTPALASKLPK